MKVVAVSSKTTVNFFGLHDVTSQKTAVFPLTVKGTSKLAEQKTEVVSTSVSFRRFIYVDIPLMLVGLHCLRLKRDSCL